jgi:hypothetical protein
MEHKGIEYQILQTLSRSKWKWVVHLSATEEKTGVTTSKRKAIDSAIKAIDSAKVAEVRERFRGGGSGSSGSFEQD